MEREAAMSSSSLISSSNNIYLLHFRHIFNEAWDWGVRAANGWTGIQTLTTSS